MTKLFKKEVKEVRINGTYVCKTRDSEYINVEMPTTHTIMKKEDAEDLIKALVFILDS